VDAVPAPGDDVIDDARPDKVVKEDEEPVRGMSVWGGVFSYKPQDISWHIF
jgi:hypothetical protein